MGQGDPEAEQGDISVQASSQLRLRNGFAWALPVFTAIGYMLFVISNAAQISYHVQPYRRPEIEPHHLYDWLGTLLAWIGLPYFVLPGQILKWLEVLNSDYEDRMKTWKADGSKSRQPMLRFCGLQPSKLPYWGATFRMLGAGYFAWASTADVINQTFKVPFSPYKQSWLVYFPYVLAPSCLIIGGTCLIWGTHHSWTGFVPVSLTKLRTLTFWIYWLSWVAGWGICQWNHNHIVKISGGYLGNQLYRGICYFEFGSLCFLVSQLIQILHDSEGVK